MPGSRCLVSSARPVVESVEPTIQIAPLSKSVETGRFGRASVVDETGKAPFRTDGRYHVFRVNLDGGFTDAVGMDVEFKRSSTR